MIARKKKAEHVTTFNASERNFLIDKFLSQGKQLTDMKGSLDENLGGVKVNKDRMKNMESADGFHMLSNLSLE